MRTMGANLVLAMIGAPVCARVFNCSIVCLFSSMRTSDSLQKNESYFYAELKRLKELKEFLLLDEILKGTNSKDKHLGSKLFLEQIIQLKGTGLVATHDIGLGELEKDYPQNIINKCFEVEIEGDQVTFDYVIRNGITKKMNAAVLMKRMGIIDN